MYNDNSRQRVHKTSKGVVVNLDSNWTGSMSGRRVLVPWGVVDGLDANTSLDAEYGTSGGLPATYGDVCLRAARDEWDGVKVLRRGWVVR